MSNVLELTLTENIVEVEIGGGISLNTPTNLAYTASPTNGIVTSSTGTNATIPSGSTTNASLMLPADKTTINKLTPVAPLALTQDGVANATLLNTTLANASVGQRIVFPDGTFPVNAPLFETRGTQWITTSRYSTRLRWAESALLDGQACITSNAQSFNLGGVAIEWLGGELHPTKRVDGLKWSRDLDNPDGSPALDSVGRNTLWQPEIRGMSNYAIIVDQAINIHVWNPRYINCRNGFKAQSNQRLSTSGLEIISTTICHWGGYWENIRENGLEFDNCSQIILDGNTTFENCGYNSSLTAPTVPDIDVISSTQLPKGAIVARSTDIQMSRVYWESNRLNFVFFDCLTSNHYPSAYNHASVPAVFATEADFPTTGDDSITYLAQDTWATSYWGFSLDELGERTGSPHYIRYGASNGTYSRSGTLATLTFPSNHNLIDGQTYEVNFPTGGAVKGNFPITVVSSTVATLNTVESGTIAIGSVEVFKPSRSVYPTLSDLQTTVSGTFNRVAMLCTANVVAHGLTNNTRYRIDFDDALLVDDEYIVTVIDANTFTFNTVASGSASGALTVTKIVLTTALDDRNYCTLDTGITWTYDQGTLRFKQKWVPEFNKYYGASIKKRGRISLRHNFIEGLGERYDAKAPFQNKSELGLNRNGRFTIFIPKNTRKSYGSTTTLEPDVPTGFVSSEGLGLNTRSSWGWGGSVQIASLNGAIAQENLSVSQGVVSTASPAQAVPRHILTVGNQSSVASNLLTSATAGQNVTTANLVASLRPTVARYHRGTATSQQSAGFLYQSLFTTVFQQRLGGTFNRSLLACTATVTGHGLSSGVYELHFPTGVSTNGNYTITVVDANTFTFNSDVSGTLSNVSINVVKSATLDATCRLFVGMCSQVNSLASNSLADITDMIGLFKDTNDVNWQAVRRTGSGTLQKVDTGIAIQAFQLVELKIACAGYDANNGSPVVVEAYVHNADGTTDTLVKSTYTTNLPSASTFLAERIAVQNGSGGSASSIGHISTSIGRFMKNDARF